MEAALRAIGWSAHTGNPRFGPKAQLARWGLGLDELPEGQWLTSPATGIEERPGDSAGT